LTDAVHGSTAGASAESIQFEIWRAVLYPSDYHRGLLAAVLVELENIHCNAVSKFLRGHRSLCRGQRAMVGTRKLIRGN